MASTHYINNKEFLALLIAHRNALADAEKKKLPAPQISDEIGLCFLDMAQRISKRPNFSSYTFREDMVSEAVENCLLYIRNFNPDISQNPFGYFTTTIYYAFFRRIEREKKDLYMKYKSAEMQGYVDSPIQDEMINTRHLTVYDNISDYINTFEQKREEKRIKQEKKKKKKGLETFMEEE